MASLSPSPSASIAPTHWRRRWRDPYLWALLIVATVYAIIFTRLAWEYHAGMRTHRSDLG